MLDMIKKLSAMPGVSGRECAVRQEIFNKAQSICEHVKVDDIGNVIAFKKGKHPSKQRVMFSAHMDEVGFFISYIEENGFLRFKTVGGIDRAVLTGARVLVGEKALPAVVAARPVHLLSKDNKGAAPSLTELYIYTGADSRKEVMEHGIMPGDFAVFDSEFTFFGDGFFKGKAFDDRAGCALLLNLMEKEPYYDTYFAFTVLEEEGLYGAAGAAFNIKPDIAVVVEATTAADIGGTAEDERVCALRKGPVLSFLDGCTLYDAGLYNTAQNIADKNNIPWQPKTVIAGGNDAGAIQASAGGARVLAVSLPCRYLHTPSCVMHKSDIDAVAKLLDLLCQELGGLDYDREIAAFL